MSEYISYPGKYKHRIPKYSSPKLVDKNIKLKRDIKSYFPFSRNEMTKYFITQCPSAFLWRPQSTAVVRSHIKHTSYDWLQVTKGLQANSALH